MMGADMVMTTFLFRYYYESQSETYYVVAYQVSGEYSMIKNASKNKIFDLDSAVIESLLSIKRSGADLISYFTSTLRKDY